MRLSKFLHSIYDINGIRTYKVFLLRKICKKTGAKVVLTSSWRNAYYRSYKDVGHRGKSLKRKFHLFKIPVIDKTPKIIGCKRGMEIKKWLDEHPEVTKFIILDDESFDIKDLYENELIITSKDERLIGTCNENSGLNKNHIKLAIKKLKE